METYDNETLPEPSWWKRNRKWALPVGGCLSLIIIVITVIVVGAFGLVESVKENTKYDEVIAKAQSNEAVIDALGTPIDQDGIGSYNISITNGHRTSSATIPIKGPKGKAELYVSTSGKDDNLTYEQIEVYIEYLDQTINLLPLEETKVLESI